MSSIVFTFGNFVPHLTQEFGWGRAQISIAFSIYTYVIVVVSPVVGYLVDRFGPRKVILPSTLIFGPVLISMYWLQDNIWHLYLSYFLIASLGAATAPNAYAKATVNWFDRRRGLALGLALTGSGLGAILTPQIVQYAINNYGWREGYAVIGMVPLVLVFPLVWFLLKDAPDRYGLKAEPGRGKPSGSEAGVPKSRQGVTLRQASRTPQFWILIIAFVLVGISIPGILAHFVPLLIERGISPAKATAAMSVFGVSLILGRILAGVLMDLFFAPYVAAVFLLGPAAGLAILGLGADGNIVFLTAILVGLAIGAEFDVMTFLSSRYFGLKSTGTISGMAFAAFHIGGGIGPFVMGYTHDKTGEYIPALWGLSLAAVLAAALISRMGPYPKELE